MDTSDVVIKNACVSSSDGSKTSDGFGR